MTELLRWNTEEASDTKSMQDQRCSHLGGGGAWILGTRYLANPRETSADERI
ncbi:MAG: hypothetical protein AAF483_22055 [Planctomycetota bacterium]